MIVTYTGRYFDYDNITKDSIYIKDIIPAITRLNRFMGHTSRPYGVGEHTLMCYLMAKKLGLSTREKLLVLVHDFTEAYCGDVNTDLKNLVPKFREIENEIEMAIYDYLGIEPPTEEEKRIIDSIDLTMLVLEMRDLTHHDHELKIQEIGDYMIFEMLEDEDFFMHMNEEISEDYLIDYLHEIFESLMSKIKES